MTEIGEKLRLARMEADKTLREAGEETGISKDTISSLERGIRMPQPLTIARLARAYGRSPEEFLESPKEGAPRGSGLSAKRQAPASQADVQTLARRVSEITEELEWVRAATFEELREERIAQLREELLEAQRALTRAIHRGGPPTEPEISKERRRRARPLLQDEEDANSEVG